MKFFVDTAEVAEIRALAELGMVDGVTTNPSLIAKSGRDMKQVIAEICAITPGPVSAEVTATDAAKVAALKETCPFPGVGEGVGADADADSSKGPPSRPPSPPPPGRIAAPTS